MRTKIKIPNAVRRELKIAVALQDRGASMKKFVEESIEDYITNIKEPRVPAYDKTDRVDYEVQLPDDLHKKLKYFVAFQNERVSMQQTILDAIVCKLKEREDEL